MRRLSVRKMLLAVLAALACGIAVVLLAVGGGATRVAQAQGGPSAASNRASARAVAARILGDVPLPAGAAQVSSDPGVSIWLKSSVAGVRATPYAVDYHRFWRVAGDPHAVIDWIEAHRPAGAKMSSTGTESRAGTTVARSVTFAFPAVPGSISEEVLGVGVTAAKGGSTALRADSIAVWVLPRPAREVVPAGTRAVTVFIHQFGGHDYPVSTVTAQPQINELVAWIDSRQRAQPGAATCPVIGTYATLLDLRFLAAPGGRPLARAVETGCGGLSFKIRGRAAPGLDAGASLAGLLWKLGALPRCRAAQLRGSATIPAGFPSELAPVMQLGFRNVSSTVCSLKGFARVKLRGADGRPLPTRAWNSPPAPSVVVLAPHTSAAINLGPPSPLRSCRAPRAAFIEATLPGVSRAFLVAVGAGGPSFCHGRVNVDAVG